MEEIIFRLFFLRGEERAGTLKSSYPFIKYVPVVIVMSVSHVSGYAMIRTGKGSEIPPIIEESVCGCFICPGSGKYPAITVRLLLARR